MLWRFLVRSTLSTRALVFNLLAGQHWAAVAHTVCVGEEPTQVYSSPCDQQACLGSGLSSYPVIYGLCHPSEQALSWPWATVPHSSHRADNITIIITTSANAARIPFSSVQQIFSHAL